VIAETILAALVRINLIAGVAILLVLLLRSFVLHRLGASIAYWLWLVVPIAVAASFFPARERVVVAPPPDVAIAARELIDSVSKPETSKEASADVVTPPRVLLPPLVDGLLAVWLVGAGLLLLRSILSTRRLAADPCVGPALVGVLRPKLVLPPDFETRFDAQERALILAHEDIHRISGHTVVNALVELARCASWFNPLAHLAAKRFRADQELACDAAVIAAHPGERRAYAQALLKSQVGSAFVPLGCTWTSQSAKRMAERIEMVGRASLGRRGKITGATIVAAAGVALGYAAWAQQPDRVVTQVARPEAVWTPSAEAPENTLSHALEGQRHDLFVDLARKGDIDVVFFGTTSTEMWWWPARGKSVWDRALASVKAANFGSQGTQQKSLLWRMNNGELDGYEAKLVVLQAWGVGEKSAPDLPSGAVAYYSPIIAEIRRRQPQAKIVIFANFPRGFQSIREWRELADANASAFAGLVDDETVFYVDIGERFYLPDGSYNRELWGTPGPAGVGIQPAAFEVWAEELQPWLDRFVR
jgi:beta-lactamase regulating signal transducer with metallopeptidase domain